MKTEMGPYAVGPSKGPYTIYVNMKAVKTGTDWDEGHKILVKIYDWYFGLVDRLPREIRGYEDQLERLPESDDSDEKMRWWKYNNGRPQGEWGEEE